MKGNIEFLAENSINAGKQIVSTEAPAKDTQSMGRQSRRRKDEYWYCKTIAFFGKINS